MEVVDNETIPIYKASDTALAKIDTESGRFYDDEFIGSRASKIRKSKVYLYLDDEGYVRWIMPTVSNSDSIVPITDSIVPITDSIVPITDFVHDFDTVFPSDPISPGDLISSTDPISPTDQILKK